MIVASSHVTSFNQSECIISGNATEETPPTDSDLNLEHWLYQNITLYLLD